MTKTVQFNLFNSFPLIDQSIYLCIFSLRCLVIAVSWLLCCKPHHYTEAQLCRPVVLNVFSHVHRVLCLCSYLKSKGRSAGFHSEGNTFCSPHTYTQWARERTCLTVMDCALSSPVKRRLVEWDLEVESSKSVRVASPRAAIFKCSPSIFSLTGHTLEHFCLSAFWV